MRWARALPIWSVAFPVIYLATMFYNWPVFTYVPKTREFHWLFFAPPKADGPGMYYYGWLLTAAFGAVVVALAASAAPEKTGGRNWSGLTWLAPLCVVGALLYILRPWFMQ